MDMFEKASKTAKNVGETVISSAKTFGTSLYSFTKEQSELTSLNVQKSVIEKKLEESYAEIGKRYVAYISECTASTVFDVNDILDTMSPELEKLNEVKAQIQEKELQIKQASEERAKKKAQDEFDEEKSKLDKALEMDIITEEEYTAKLETARRKIDNYDKLRKIELQLDMGIITRVEYEEKVKNVLQ